MKKIGSKITNVAVAAQVDQGQQRFVDEADRRLRIEGCPVPPTASLRWNKRPVTPKGNPGYMYMVDSPEGSFAVFISHLQNGSPLTGTPFEVWVNGEEAPRGLSDLARNLSIDMRSEDRAWLRRKLEALMKTDGKPFNLAMPDGTEVRARSAVDAFARLVQFRCEELGAFTESNLDSTPVVDALMSKREPKTTGDGSMGWYVDVENVNTGDEFIVVLKEAEVDGRTRPFSIWFSGTYPRSLDGLAKSLSLDMRVNEPAWVARKLKQLIDVSEERGEFWACVPGMAQKKQCYPSTIAYVAAVVQHRFKELGLFNSDGHATVDSGVVHLADVRQKKGAQVSPNGGTCASCNAVGALILMDGCWTCTSCGNSKCN